MNSTPSKKESVLTFIKQFHADIGYPPTIKEIGAALGMANSLVHYYQGKLIMEGRLERVAHSARALKVL